MMERYHERRLEPFEVMLYLNGDYAESYDGLVEATDAIRGYLSNNNGETPKKWDIERTKDLIASGAELCTPQGRITLDISTDSPFDIDYISEGGKKKAALFIELRGGKGE